MYVSHTMKIKRGYEQASIKALTQAGYHLRGRIRKSIRVKNKRNGYDISRPGEPPKVASASSPLRKYILFNVDKPRKRLIVGAAQWLGGKGIKGSQTVPERLEEGGTAIIKTWKTAPRKRIFRNNPNKTRWQTIQGGVNRGKLPHDRKTGKAIYIPDGQFYFRSKSAWERARRSPNFLRWCLTKRFVELRHIRSLPRPFIRPALERYVNEGELERDLKKAISDANKRLIAKRSVGGFGGLGFSHRFRDD